MNIKSISSSSAGCCYIVESFGKKIIIDAGIPLSKIREAVRYDFSCVVGCLVSHEHGDHAKYLGQIEQGTYIPIHCTKGTVERFNLSLCHILSRESIHLKDSDFVVSPLPLVHDCECFGFLISSGNKTLFYATDTGKVNYTIGGLTYLMIECNFSFELILKSNRPKSVIKRTSETHLSLDVVIEFVSRHKDLEEIHLLHLSDDHSDVDLFKKRIQEISGVLVYVSGK